MEPINRACKTFSPSFYYSSDSLALQPSTCMWSYCWTSCFWSKEERRIILRSGFSLFHKHTCIHTGVRQHTSACYFMKDDQMTRWAVINELSTEHFRPSGKRVPWQSRSVSGHRGRGTAAQRALCLCQTPPEDCCMGPAHLNNIRLLRVLHLSVLISKKLITFIMLFKLW